MHTYSQTFTYLCIYARVRVYINKCTHAYIIDVYLYLHPCTQSICTPIYNV